MINKNTLLITLVLGFLFSCSKPQPTEIEKARIKPMMASCMVAVTRMPGSNDAPLADAFSLLGQYIDSSGELMTSAEDMKKQWELLSEEPRTVNMEFSLDETNYSCDVVLKDDWVIEEVRRNDEVVFNLKEDKRVKEENEQIKKQQKLAKIKNWEELGYSNVAYKYYKKRHTESKESSFAEQYVKFNCPDEGPQFQHEGFFSGKKNVDVKIKFKNEEEVVKKNQVIDDYGYIGAEITIEYSFGIDSDRFVSNTITAFAKDIHYVVVDGYRYNFDDISQVKCLE